MKRITLIVYIISIVFFTQAQDPCVQCPTNGTVTNGGSAIGPNNSTNGGIAIGSNAHASYNGTNTIAIGTAVESANVMSFIIGEGGGEYRFVNNRPQSLMIGFNSQYPTLFIEAAPTSYQYKSTGKIGIGNITNLQGLSAKLHIRSDQDEDANILLDVAGWESGKTADIYFGGMFNRISAGSGSGIEFYTENGFFFENGPIGIGTENPLALLHLFAKEEQSANIFLESEYWASGQQASIALGNSQHRINANFDDGLVFNTASNFLFKDGRVGIGNIIQPQAKLHIKGSELETPNIFLEPFRFDTEKGASQAGLYLGDFEHGISYNSAVGLMYLTANNHVFQGGNVGIGVLEPAALFHIQDGSGAFLFEGSKAIIKGSASASLSLMVDNEQSWDLSNLANDDVLYFKHNNLSKMALLPDYGLWVDKMIMVCDLQAGNPYPFPRAGVNVIINGEVLDKKGAEFATTEGGRIFFVPRLGDYRYNPLTIEGDAGIFWSNTTNQNSTGGLVIGPHATDVPVSGIRIDQNGNLGIGLSLPEAKLHVNSQIMISGWNPKSFVIKTAPGEDGEEVFAISSTGQTWISNKLWAEEIEVLADVSWPDFVFEDTYSLPSLSELEVFIAENKHLPDVPSQQEVIEDGHNLGEMDAILLQKIEELTLYIIEQDKRIDMLNERIEELSSDK